MASRWPRCRAVCFRLHPLLPPPTKTFQDDALDDAAITLEADLKDESGTVESPVIKLKEQAAAKLRAGDLESAAFIYGQIVTVAPNDSAAWRRLADIWLAIPPDDNDDGSTRYENAGTAAYIAYQRATSPKGRGRGALDIRHRLRQARRMARRR